MNKLGRRRQFVLLVFSLIKPKKSRLLAKILVKVTGVIKATVSTCMNRDMEKKEYTSIAVEKKFFPTSAFLFHVLSLHTRNTLLSDSTPYLDYAHASWNRYVI